MSEKKQKPGEIWKIFTDFRVKKGKMNQAHGESLIEHK